MLLISVHRAAAAVGMLIMQQQLWALVSDLLFC